MPPTSSLNALVCYDGLAAGEIHVHGCIRPCSGLVMADKYAAENLVQTDALLFEQMTYETMELPGGNPARRPVRCDWMQPFGRILDAQYEAFATRVTRQLAR